METQINLEKMSTFHEAPVRYELKQDQGSLNLNQCLDKLIKIEFLGPIICVGCSKKTKKSFNQGYCYSCFIKLAACDLCIMQPEKCHFAQGTCREPEWGESHCNVPHIVYLAYSSGLKVGITRKSQVPTRFMDQGATKALPILEVKSRYHSGLIEDSLKKFIPDRTQWQKMLKGEEEEINLVAAKNELLPKISDLIKTLDAVILPDDRLLNFQYPVLQYPKKVTSFNLDKEPLAQGKLMGIKGQYLILDTGVINLRKYTGYQILFQCEEIL
jgi:hypothetical protein